MVFVHRLILWFSFLGGRKSESETEQLVIIVFAGKREDEGPENRGKHTDSKYFVDYHWLRWRAKSPRRITLLNFNDVLGVFPPVKHLHRQIKVSLHVSEASYRFILHYHSMYVLKCNIHVLKRILKMMFQMFPCLITPDSNKQVVIRLQQSLLTCWSRASGVLGQGEHLEYDPLDICRGVLEQDTGLLLDVCSISVWVQKYCGTPDEQVGAFKCVSIHYFHLCDYNV